MKYIEEEKPNILINVEVHTNTKTTINMQYNLDK